MRIFFLCWLTVLSTCFGQSVAYIHGDVAADGTIPSGSAAPYDQMLIDDSGNTGLTSFRSLVQSQGYTISQHYDVETTLDDAFLGAFDVVIFGLHQKMWSELEKDALRRWLNQGGGMMIYSDSASGGRFNIVGINNPVGRNVTNNLIAEYGMEVTVDLGSGTRSYISDVGSANPIVWDQPEFEGEGVSPVAVDPQGEAQVLIPLEPSNQVEGNGNLNLNSSLTTITNPLWAAMAHRRVGRGNIIVTFDRQPMWNNGPGSDIDRKDNREIIRRVVRFLARDYGNSAEWRQFRLESRSVPLEVSWRQWAGGSGRPGVDYTARNVAVHLQSSQTLEADSWTTDSAELTLIGAPVDNGDETERITMRVVPTSGIVDRLFTRLVLMPDAQSSAAITLDAGQARLIGENGRVLLEPRVSGGSGSLSFSWSKLSGPGTASFADASQAQTTATFDQAGVYTLQLMASDGLTASSDQIGVRVVAEADIVRAINCGALSGTQTGLNGVTYEPDAFFTPSNSRVDNFPNNPVAATEDDDIYNTARSQFSTYSIPVANGSYTVYLQFAETFFTSANQRVFDLSVEGDLVLDDLDLAASAPGRWVSYDRSIQTTVADGQLTLSTTASVNNSLLNAFVIVRE